MNNSQTSRSSPTGPIQPLQLTSTIDEALATIIRVEQTLAERGTPCHSGSALGALFAKVRRLNNPTKPLNDEQWRAIFPQANEAMRIARAIEVALEEVGSKEAIHRITRSDMNLSKRKQSRGKDALWELDLYRRFKLGNVKVRFDEPDLVVSLREEFGDYGISCKKVYFEQHILDRLRDGCRQLRNHGLPGIVAFNLDDLILGDSVWEESKQDALRSRMNASNFAFVNRHKEHFLKAISRGDCDGILVCTCVISNVRDMKPPINVFWSTAVLNEGANPDAKRRISAFLQCLDAGLSQKREID